MNNSSNLIDKVVSGKSAKHLIDAIIDDLLPIQSIRSQLLKEIKDKATVDVKDDKIIISTTDKLGVIERVEYYEMLYPEVEFILKEE